MGAYLLFLLSFGVVLGVVAKWVPKPARQWTIIVLTAVFVILLVSFGEFSSERLEPSALNTSMRTT